MAFTQAQLFALESAIALGVLDVQYPDGTRKTFRSLDEMQQIRRQMRQDLNIVPKSSGRRVAEYHRGLD